MAMHQQLTLLVADHAVFGIGRSFLRDECVVLSVECFNLGELLNAVSVEITFRRTVLLNLVSMGVEYFA